MGVRSKYRYHSSNPYSSLNSLPFSRFNNSHLNCYSKSERHTTEGPGQEVLDEKEDFSPVRFSSTTEDRV